MLECVPPLPDPYLMSALLVGLHFGECDVPVSLLGRMSYLVKVANPMSSARHQDDSVWHCLASLIGDLKAYPGAFLVASDDVRSFLIHPVITDMTQLEKETTIKI